MLDWHDLGDGSVYDGMPEEGESAEEVFRDPDAVRNAYGESIEYTLTSVFSFLETYPDPNLVVVVLGDHQPHSYVSGDDAGHDVPISVIAQDPSVMSRSPPGAGRRPQPVARPPPSGRWTRSATASSRRTARLGDPGASTSAELVEARCGRLWSPRFRMVWLLAVVGCAAITAAPGHGGFLP